MLGQQHSVLGAVQRVGEFVDTWDGRGVCDAAQRIDQGVVAQRERVIDAHRLRIGIDTGDPALDEVDAGTGEQIGNLQVGQCLAGRGLVQSQPLGESGLRIDQGDVDVVAAALGDPPGPWSRPCRCIQHRESESRSSCCLSSWIVGGYTPDVCSGQNCDISTQGEFSVYGPSHWAVFAVFAVGAVAAGVARPQADRAARRARFGRVVGALTAAIYAAAFVYALFPPDLRWSVPLHLTDLATMVTAYAMWSQRHWAYALTYYWGLVLSVQALISPVLTGPDFPNYQFLGFWAIHLLVVWAAIYLTWGRGMRPGMAQLPLRGGGDADVGGGHHDVQQHRRSRTTASSTRNPRTASLLDVLGPWPWYVLIGGVLVAAVWALMTWPWERGRGGQTPGRRNALRPTDQLIPSTKRSSAPVIVGHSRAG